MVNITIDDITITSDKVCWVLKIKNSITYYGSFPSLLNSLADTKLRYSKATSLKEMGDAMVDIRKLIVEIKESLEVQK